MEADARKFKPNVAPVPVVGIGTGTVETACSGNGTNVEAKYTIRQGCVVGIMMLFANSFPGSEKYLN